MSGPCICRFPTACGGLGIVFCDGCGGDLCVCPCGGQMDCDCEMCAYGDDLDDDYEATPNDQAAAAQENEDGR